jgi:uncharacterized protein YifN (PemK superfamily)
MSTRPHYQSNRYHDAIERLDIVLSDFYPDICPWADIAMALPVATYRQNLRYYVYI